MTIGEILSKAILNTCLGMGTVFFMLLFISCIIYMFKFIPNGADKNHKQEAERIITSRNAGDPSEEAAYDDEIAVVIAAAIHAFEEDKKGILKNEGMRQFTARKFNKR